MRPATAGFVILLTSAIYLAVDQFHASYHASAGLLDANGKAAIVTDASVQSNVATVQVFGSETG
jgi:hypothetical protein